MTVICLYSIVSASCPSNYAYRFCCCCSSCFRWGLPLSPGLDHGSLKPQLSGLKPFPSLSLLSSWDSRCVPPHAANVCIFCRAGVSHVAQAGLELLNSSDLPTLAFPRTGITGVSHCTWPTYCFVTVTFLMMNMFGSSFSTFSFFSLPLPFSLT